MKQKKTIIRSVTVSQSINFILPVIEPLIKMGYNVVVLSNPGPELYHLKELGVKTYSVAMERDISIKRDIISLFSLIRFFKQEKPYMVHSMTPKAGLLCMLAAWLCRVPRRVHTFTGLVWPSTKGFKRWILMITDWATCFCATHIIPEGRGVMNDLQSHITRKPMKVLGYGNVRGVDLVRFSLRPEIEDLARRFVSKDHFTFIYIGRLVGDKGLNELIEAFIRLLSYSISIRLFLIGSFEESHDPLKEKTKEIINNTSSIQFLGPKVGDELVAYYLASDCFVLPSYREGFPNAVLEAGAMGLPCVVTDVNGCREIIENEVNGLIVPPHNSDALFRAMKTMVEDKKSYKRMKDRARFIIESRFEQSFVCNCLLEYYEEIIQH